MAFSRTWDTAYETIPADTDQAKEGALRIRNLKVDIRERSEIDHEWDDATDGGFHKKVTLIEQASDPAVTANRPALYSKDVAGISELFYKDDASTVQQLTLNGNLNEFASGTKMLFNQTAAPTGWTKDVVEDDKALRVVSGTVGTGGAVAFSTVFGTGKVTGSHTLTIAQMPSHTHTHSGAGPVMLIDGIDFGGGGGNKNDTPFSLNSVGGGSGHTHTLSDLDLGFVDVIIATKD